MKIWKLTTDGKGLVVIPKNHSKDGYKTDFEGIPVANWEPHEFVSSHRKDQYSDFSKYVNGTPVLSRKAIDLLKPIIDSYAQILPIIHDQELFVINIINVLDCVDYDRSDYLMMPSGKFGGFKKIYFKENKVTDQWIFKIKEEVAVNVYVTDKFRDFVLQSDLKGYEFIEVWDSENTVEVEKEKSCDLNRNWRKSSKPLVPRFNGEQHMNGWKTARR